MTLSPRMVQIVTLVGRDDLRWDKVGQRLGISRSTMMIHVRKAMTRFGLEKRTPRSACVVLYLTHVVQKADHTKG